MRSNLVLFFPSTLLFAAILACGPLAGVTSGGGISFEEASELVIEQVVQPEASGDPPQIVFGLQDPLQAGDVLAPYTVEGYPGPAEAFEADEATWFFWIDDAPGAMFVHPTRFVFVRQSDGHVTVQDQDWWPVLNGQGLWISEDEYWDRTNWIYSNIETPAAGGESGGRGALLASISPSAPAQNGGRQVGIVLNGWRPGERLEDMFRIDSNGIHDALTNSGFDMTYLGPAEDNNPDRDGTFEFDNWNPWFLEQWRELEAGDTLFVYLTGHGFVGHNGNGFAGPMGEDTLVNQLERIDPGVHIIVVVQACESGAFLDGLRTVADVAVVTTSNLDPAYDDIDTGQIDQIDGVDPNDDDVGSEFVSGFVETWNEIRADPAALQEAIDRASQQGTNEWEEMAALSYIGAVEKDLTAQAGWTFPSLVRGAASTRLAPTEVSQGPAPTEVSQGPAQTFSDDAGDAVVCSSGDTIDDPAVDIQSFNFKYQPGPGAVVEVFPSQSPLQTIEDYSFAMQAQVGQDGGYIVGVYEIHAGVEFVGEMVSVGEIVAGTEENVVPLEESLIFRFPIYVPMTGDTVTIRSFHMETESSPRTCDISEAFEIDLSLFP